MNSTDRGAPRSIRSLLSMLAAGALLAIAVPVLAETTPTDPEPDLECPAEHGTGTLTHYETTVETPADSTNWFVSVTFTLIGNGECELTLATYDLPDDSLSFPQQLHDADTGTFGAGTHTLTAVLPLDDEHPGCWAQYDFVFGPPIETLTEDTPYDGSVQIRARIVGAPECFGGQLGGAPTPTPRDGELGGTPSATPAGGTLPDTSYPSSTAPSPVLSIVFLAAIALLTARLAHARASDRDR